MSVTLTIDGRRVTAEAGETVLACAQRHDVQIPHLCNHPNLPPFGACRMCVVEIEGMRGYPTSCTTPVADGMVVQTNTAGLKKLRRNILSLMMLEHPNACLICGKRDLCEEYRPKAEKVGRTTGCHTCNNKEVCEVRELSAELEFSKLPVAPVYHERPIERSNPFIDRDLNLCILCGRCVRICKHHQGRAVIDFIGRSSKSRVGEAFDRSLQEAGCTFCGSCVDVCPTGSLSDRFAKWYGKPDRISATTCVFCDAACALTAKVSGGKLTNVQGADGDKPLCVLGRFALPEFLNGVERLHVPRVRVGKVLREVAWDYAVEAAAGKLEALVGDGFAFVCDNSSTLEDRHVFKKFTHDVMKSPHYIEIEADARGVSRATLPEGVKAVFLTGDFVDAAQLEGVELLIVQDCYPTPLSERADIVFPAAVFAEVDGTIVDKEGRYRPLHKACDAPGEAKPEWAILSEIAQAMKAEGYGYDSAKAVAQELGISGAKFRTGRKEAPAPALEPKLARTFFRGHRLVEKVAGLRGVLADECAIEMVAAPPSDSIFEILRKSEIAPNTHEMVIHAPEVAKKAQAGQFAIVMADAVSERVPYTLCDWNEAEGTITLVVQEKGQSSRKLILMQAGDKLAHVVGPLGISLEIKNYGTVALAAGCYGIGAIVPIAKAMKAAGNRVMAIIEARSHYLAYYRDKLEALADEFIQTTIDGSTKVQGHAIDAITQKLDAGEVIDCVIAVGCPFMMMLTAKETKPYGVKTLAALNPIMVDGTGMCGACRVSVGGETKFACVDGPFFDAHLVDWYELRDRREAYSAEEIQSLGRTEPVTIRRHGEHHCVCS